MIGSTAYILAISKAEIPVGVSVLPIRFAEATQYLEWLQDLWRKNQAAAACRGDPHNDSSFFFCGYLCMRLHAHVESE